jgi:hypothetical protein
MSKSDLVGLGLKKCRDIFNIKIYLAPKPRISNIEKAAGHAIVPDICKKCVFNYGVQNQNFGL